MKSHYNNLLSEIYQEIQSQGDMPEDGWSVVRQPEYGITTWTLDEDRALGRTGTNSQLQVKLFESGSYDFVKTEDYLTRGQLVCDAAKRLIDRYHTRYPELQNQFANWIAQVKSSFDADIKQNAVLDPARIRSGDSKYFDEQHAKAKFIIRQLLANVATAVQAAKPSLSFSAAVDAIQASEKEFIKEQGRPNIIKIGRIGEKDEIQMVSAQFTQGTETIPSTLREGNYETKLSNHVLDCTALLTNETIDVKLLIDGHGSYTPINDRSDMWSRIRTGTEALKEKIAAGVKDILDENPNLGSKENPIQYPLSSMMMLTPTRLKKLENKIRSGESDAEQIREGRLVMEIVKHSAQPLEMKVNGASVYVNFNHTFMNIPANEIALLQKVIPSNIQQGMNSKGFIEYIELMQQDSQQRLTQCLNEAGNLLVVALKRCQGNLDLDSDALRKDQAALRNEYRNLAYYLENPTKNEEYNNTLKNIDKLEASINKHHHAALKEYQNRYHNPDMVAFALQELNAALQKPELSPDLREYLVMQKRFIQARDMFFNESYLKPENTYIFQALYLLSSSQKGRNIECFCKSGEDRTGWMRVTLMAITAYNAVHGRDPNFTNNEDRTTYQRFYSNAAHELSASLENTAYNSGSRGMQVAGKCTTLEKPMECDRAMATLAMTLFDDHSGLKPNRSCEMIDNRLVGLVGEAMNRQKSNSFIRIRNDSSVTKRSSFGFVKQGSFSSSKEATPEGSPLFMSKR